jgi:excisionase family DNA binding protein
MTRESSWVSIAQAAEQLGIHPRTLRRYIRDGRLSVLRLSAQVVRIRPEDIADFLESNIRIETGTGTCYVPRAEEPQTGPTGSLPSTPRSQRPRPERLAHEAKGSGRY